MLAKRVSFEKIKLFLWADDPPITKISATSLTFVTVAAMHNR